MADEPAKNGFKLNALTIGMLVYAVLSGLFFGRLDQKVDERTKNRVYKTEYVAETQSLKERISANAESNSAQWQAIQDLRRDINENNAIGRLNTQKMDSLIGSVAEIKLMIKDD